MSTTDIDEAYVAFASASMRDLRRTAYLLCGDWARADDAVQNALIKVYLRWRRLDKENSLWSYARRAVVNAVMDERRTLWLRGDTLVDEIPQTPQTIGGDETGTVDDRTLLRLALAALPARQRAVVVFRYVYDLDVADTAAALKLPLGTVTSSGARALLALRRFLVAQGYVRSGAS